MSLKLPIEVRRDGRYVSAMGHRVADREGGLRELKRRCLETLSHYDCPPDEIRFLLLEPPHEVLPPPAEPEPAETVAETVEAAPRPSEEQPPTIPARPQRGPGPAKAKERTPGVAKAKDRR
jgi:hypothetical protein